AQQLGESSRDRETEAGAFGRLRFCELHEFVEDAFLVARRDALTLIDDVNRDASVVAPCDGDANRLAASELDRVREQVEKNLPHAPRIRLDAERSANFVDRERRAESIGERTDGDEEIFDDR